jgi:hypothetical protein
MEQQRSDVCECEKANGVTCEHPWRGPWSWQPCASLRPRAAPGSTLQPFMRGSRVRGMRSRGVQSCSGSEGCVQVCRPVRCSTTMWPEHDGARRFMKVCMTQSTMSGQVKVAWPLLCCPNQHQCVGTMHSSKGWQSCHHSASMFPERIHTVQCSFASGKQDTEHAMG